MIKYKILSIDTTQLSIVVRYYTDIITEVMLATDTLEGVIRSCRTDLSIDLPIPVPTGAMLDDFIIQFAPVDWILKMETLANTGIDLNGLDLLVGVEKEVSPIATNLNIAPVRNDALLEQKIKSVVAEMLAGNT